MKFIIITDEKKNQFFSEDRRNRETYCDVLKQGKKVTRFDWGFFSSAFFLFICSLVSRGNCSKTNTYHFC